MPMWSFQGRAEASGPPGGDKGADCRGWVGGPPGAHLNRGHACYPQSFFILKGQGRGKRQRGGRGEDGMKETEDGIMRLVFVFFFRLRQMNI